MGQFRIQQAVLTALITVLLMANASAKPALQKIQRGMWSEQPATRWQDALVTGNGTLGAMVLGNPGSERIILNHERLYEPLRDKPCPVPDIADALPEVRRLLLAKKYREALSYSYQAAVDDGFPGIQWTDPYHPACALIIQQKISTSVEDYWRSTDFNTGELTVHWQDGDRVYQRQTFASRPDGIVVQRIAAKDGSKLEGTIQLVNQDDRPASQRVNEFGGGYQDPIIYADSEWLAYQCKYDRSKRGYQVVARIVLKSGTSQVDDNAIHFAADEVLVLISIVSLEDFATADASLAKMRKKLLSINEDYSTLLQRHARVHGEMMGRVTLELGDGQYSDLSSEAFIQLQKSTADEKLQSALLQKMFDMGRYTLICSSGEWPPNLMGIWNGEWRPKWSGDFTLDANVNLQIAGANLGNLPEALTSYSDLFASLIPDWQVNAQNLFGCRGVVSGTRTDGRHNLHTHFSDRFAGQMWTAGAQWLVLPMWEHYQTTGDEIYLQDTLLPIMKQIAMFYTDFLQLEDANGKRLFAPSYSPENRPSNTRCAATLNATMDIACAKEALSNLIYVCESLDMQDPELSTWKALIRDLPPYLVNKDGSLKEWSHPNFEERNNHRHVSHLYPVWPGHEINSEGTPHLFQAARIAAKNRGRGNGSAHGLAHMALIGARLKDAELVCGNLRFMLSNDYLTKALTTFHNPGRIYNFDMLHSLPAVVMEMLVYSKPGEIELLPALSDELFAGSIKGVCCRNQTVVESLQWDLKQRSVKVTLLSKIDQSLTLRIRRGIESIRDLGGGQLEVKDDGTVELELVADRPAVLSIQLAE